MTPTFVYAYLNQTQWWYPNGRPRLLITDMDDRWRGNAVRWLERESLSFVTAYQFGELKTLSTPVWAHVIGEKNGHVVTDGRVYSEFDMMSDRVADMLDQEMENAQRDPVAWIRTMPLHRALISAGIL